MNIIEHGNWLPYKPTEPPKNAPVNALFAKRESDGVDWYEYVNDGKKFGADTVKLAAVYRDYAQGYVVGPAVYDATLIFPPDHVVLEITDYTGSDPQKDFGNMVIDPATGALSLIPMPAKQPRQKELEVLILVTELMKRIEKLEKGAE